MAVRRRVLQAVGPFGGISTMEDTDWGMRATAHGYRLVCLAKAKVITHANPSASWHTNGTDMSRRISQTRDGPDGQASMADHIRYRRRVALCGPLTILPADRLSGLHNRWLALKCLTRVRLYRASLMFCLVLHRGTARLLGTRKRQKS
ncbi:hypothetical protein GOB19_00165 [Sinorhizobium meliloti]|uniref:glycosyltransferase family 2 protein n=1 Tax=Rhizobium meliloti TaxID=382 RepID=UPI000FD9794A|nr:hypothetical protein [Sinorhizobium meliloti]MDX0303454.1 hypothetical protein [Sinorhizobium meliloti]RVG74432.1 hypothetical protein CN223_23885 [Sinorhizobium meliloti]